MITDPGDSECTLIKANYSPLPCKKKKKLPKGHMEIKLLLHSFKIMDNTNTLEASPQNMGDLRKKPSFVLGL